MVCLCNAIKMLVVYDSAAFKIFFNFLYCQKALHVKKNVIPILKKINHQLSREFFIL